MSEQQTNRWGRYVLKVLAKHGATYRSQRQRTGVPHSTVLGWVNLIPPRETNAMAFIRGFGEDEAAGRKAAGYDPPEADTENPADRYEAHARAFAVFCAKRGMPEPPATFQGVGADIPTLEYADDLIRQDVEAYGSFHPEHKRDADLWLDAKGLGSE